MAGKRRKPQRKCKKCNRNIRTTNKSGLCTHHYVLRNNAKYVKQKISKGLCIQCGKKVEPIITYLEGNKIKPITKIPIRCYSCRIHVLDLINLRKKDKKVIEQKKDSRQNRFTKRRKAKQLCVQCGKKVEPIIIYPDGDKVKPIIKIPIRCYQCREKQNKWQNKWLKKSKKHDLLPLLSGGKSL